jgi:hypothetical protein
MRYAPPVTSQGTRVFPAVRTFPAARLRAAARVILAIRGMSAGRVRPAAAAVGRRGGTLSAALHGPVGRTAPARAAA